MGEPVTFAKLTPAHAGEVLTLQRAAFAPEAQAHRDRQTTQAGAYLLVHLPGPGTPWHGDAPSRPGRSRNIAASSPPSQRAALCLCPAPRFPKGE